MARKTGTPHDVTDVIDGAVYRLHPIGHWIRPWREGALVRAYRRSSFDAQRALIVSIDDPRCQHMISFGIELVDDPGIQALYGIDYVSPT